CGVYYTPSGLLQSSNSPQSSGISAGLVLDAQAAQRAKQRGRSRVSKYRGSDLEGTPYGRELQRRLRLLVGKAPEFLSKRAAAAEPPAFWRTAAPAHSQATYLILW